MKQNIQTQTRIALVQALYAKQVGKSMSYGINKCFLTENKTAKINMNFYKEVFSAVTEFEQDIQSQLSKYLDIKAKDDLLRIILQLGYVEIVLLKKDIAVVISQYLIISDIYFFEKQSTLINGVLDKIGKNLR